MWIGLVAELIVQQSADCCLVSGHVRESSVKAAVMQAVHSYC